MMNKVSIIILGFFAIFIGLYPITYFVLDGPTGLLEGKPSELLESITWNTGFYAHIIFGGISLLVGWSQFSKKLRTRRIKLHRNLGKVYVISVLISSLAGIYIGFSATGGPIAKLGFICLGIVWFYTTLQAYLKVRSGKIDVHQVFMIYSFAACFAAVTLRLWLPALIALFGDFIPAYRLVSWLCWVPNLVVAYFIVRKLKTSNKSQVITS